MRNTTTKIGLLSLIVPLYDEEEVFPLLLLRLNAVRSELAMASELIFINDGSRDRTGELLNRAAEGDESIKVLHFTRNYGAPKAISAGLRVARGDAAVLMDGDLQDPPELIAELIDEFEKGYDVVFGERRSREGESLPKKLTSSLFRRLFSFFSRVALPRNTGDFCLISRRVVGHLVTGRNCDAVLRATINALAYPTSHVAFFRPARLAGQSKYSLSRMSRLAFNSLIVFSPHWLQLNLIVGALLTFGALLYGFHLAYGRFNGDFPLAGWRVMVALQAFVGGVVLLGIGAIGEYVRRNFEMLKQSPAFVIHSSRNLPPESPFETASDPYSLRERRL